jgi:hypothetical protein
MHYDKYKLLNAAYVNNTGDLIFGEKLKETYKHPVTQIHSDFNVDRW